MAFRKAPAAGRRGDLRGVLRGLRSRQRLDAGGAAAAAAASGDAEAGSDINIIWLVVYNL